MRTWAIVTRTNGANVFKLLNNEILLFLTEVLATDNQNGQTATFTLYVNILPIQKPPVFNISSPAYTTVVEESVGQIFLL